MGKQYQVQYATNLAQISWTNLGEALTATNASGSASDVIGTNSRFYRVQVAH